MLKTKTKKLIELLPKHKVVIDPYNHRMAHPTYDLKDIEEIKVTHRMPEKLRDKLAFYSVRTIRKAFDLMAGYNEQKMNANSWINRCIFLETVAGVPGMVGGMTIHLKSLTTLKEQ